MHLLLILAAIKIPLDISAIFINGIIAYVLKKHKKKSTVSFWFIYCLSISDVFVGAVSLVYHLSVILLLLDFTQTALRLLRPISGAVSGFFMAFSGRLIVIISVDRCIHMKYHLKYRTLMTLFKARLIILLSIIYGILPIPFFLASKKLYWWFELGFNICNSTMISMVYIVYIMTYASIKRRVQGRRSLETTHRAERMISDEEVSCRSKLPNEKHKRESVEMETNGTMNVPADSCKAANRVFIKEDAALHSLDEISNIPNSIAMPSHPMKSKTSFNFDTGNEATNSDLSKDDQIFGITEEKKKTVHPNRNKKQQRIENKAVKKEKRRAKPEAEFLKAICLILSSLFLCYAPVFIYDFYNRGARNPNKEISSLLYAPVIMNSSLNAVILIVCNRELKRHIKELIFPS